MNVPRIKLASINVTSPHLTPPINMPYLTPYHTPFITH